MDNQIEKTKNNETETQTLSATTVDTQTEPTSNVEKKTAKGEKPIGGYVLFSFTSLFFLAFVYFAALILNTLAHNGEAPSASEGIGASFLLVFSLPGIIAAGVLMGLFAILTIVKFAITLAKSDNISVKKSSKIFVLVVSIYVVIALTMTLTIILL